MKVYYEGGLCKCKCGGKPRYRYREPFHWVECQAKRCGERTRYYKDINGQFDLGAKDRAFEEWNEKEKYCPSETFNEELIK